MKVQILIWSVCVYFISPHPHNTKFLHDNSDNIQTEPCVMVVVERREQSKVTGLY